MNKISIQSKKMTVGRVILLILAIPVLGLLVIAGLNMSGMCVSEFRYLSGAERVEITILGSGAIRTGPPRKIGYRENGVSKLELDPVIYYKNLTEFRKANPDCCFIGTPNNSPNRKPYLEYHLAPEFRNWALGRKSTIVYVRWKERFRSDDGTIEVRPNGIARWQSGCGELFRSR